MPAITPHVISISTKADRPTNLEFIVENLTLQAAQLGLLHPGESIDTTQTSYSITRGYNVIAHKRA